MYSVQPSRVERVWDFAQSNNLPMYRKRIQRVGHTRTVCNRSPQR